MGRQAILFIAGFAIILGLMRLGLDRGTKQVGKISFAQFEESAARNAAHSAAQLSLTKLKQNLSWRTGYSNLSLSGAQVTLRIVDHSTDPSLGTDTIRIESRALSGNEDAQVNMKVSLGHPTFPPNVRAGITARADIGTLGNMLVDGRDHDANGNVIADNGLQAITTTETYRCGGSTALCGTTEAGTDVGPLRSGYDAIVEEGYTWPGSYPSTPEAVLGGSAVGLGSDMLKTAAMSGANGSQYVTNPADLHLPLRGVTYVELPDNGIWQPVDFGLDGDGILVVHNTYNNALMYNLNSGTFRGMIIADDVLHIHSDIIGALFLLTDHPREGNCIGNGSGRLKLSRDTVIKSLETAQIGLTTVSVLDCWE